MGGALPRISNLPPNFSPILNFLHFNPDRPQTSQNPVFPVDPQLAVKFGHYLGKRSVIGPLLLVHAPVFLPILGH